MTTQNENIQRIMEFLIEWNPLGTRAGNITDLDNYRTEAMDILFNLTLSASNKKAAQIVQEVINQAFDLSLSVADCAVAGRTIQEIIKKT